MSYHPSAEGSDKFNFQFKESQVLERLKDTSKKYKIKLKGNFSMNLLSELEEVVRKQKITLPTDEEISFTGKLVLDI